jgi:hypothetical protein
LINLECLKIAVVYSQNRAGNAKGHLQLGLAPGLGENVETAHARAIREFLRLSRGQRAHDQEHGRSTVSAGFKHLQWVNTEVLAQDGNPEKTGCIAQIRNVTAKAVGFRKYGDSGGARALKGQSQRCRIE